MIRSARVRTDVCWLFLVSGAAVSGCGDSEKQSGEPSGSDGGVATGGSGNAVGGSAPSGGSGGTALGGGPSSGGTAGTGGTVVLDPPGLGIACGETTCAEGSEMCCVGESDPWCDASQCVSAIARLECDDSADCPGERCCYTNISAMNWIVTRCGSACGSLEDIQVCKEAGECDNGDPCHAFVCGGLDTRNVVIGLCTATAPMNCE